MAHDITDTDGFFSVRQPAWHGLGNVLSEYPSRAEAQQIAHPWEPISEPLYRRVPVILPHTHNPDCDPEGCDLQEELATEFEELTDSVLNVRSDNSFPLGVVSTSFTPVTNGEMWDIAEALQGEASDVSFETGGSLQGGKKVWILVRLNEPLVLKGDPTGTVPYYALQNSHDATGAFRGQATMTRIVCMNTSQVADMDAQARGTEFIFRHTKNVRDRIEEARQALTGWRDSVQRWRLVSEHLLDVRIGTEQRVRFVEEFIPMPPPHSISDRVVQHVQEARGQLYTILDSETCEGISHTAYGLTQASIEYLCWARKAKTEATRFKRSFLDRNRIVTDAVSLALEVATS